MSKLETSRLEDLMRTFKMCGLKKEQWLEMQGLAHKAGYNTVQLCRSGELVKN